MALIMIILLLLTVMVTAMAIAMIIVMITMMIIDQLGAVATILLVEEISKERAAKRAIIVKAVVVIKTSLRLIAR
jgi:hypothetical protein